MKRRMSFAGYSRREFMRIAGVGAAGWALSPILAACAQLGLGGGGADRPLIIAVPTDPEGLDPDGGAEKMTFTVNRHLSSFLTRFKVNPEGDGLFRFDRTTVEPYLAESFTVSDDGKTITFVLRDKDIQFPSGNSFTMEDVTYSFERMIGTQGLGAFELGVGSITSMDQLQVVDDRTLVVTLPTPDPLITRVLGMVSVCIYDSKLVQANSPSDDPWGIEFCKQNPPGLGPYVLDEYTVGRELIMSPNPEHPEPGLAPLTFKIVPAAEQRALLLQQGDVDMALGLPLRLVKEMQGQEGLRVISAPGLFLDNLGLNHAVEPFDNKLVRQALSYAVPYERILDEVYYGFAQAEYGPLEKGIPGYQADAWYYSEDLDKARSLLAEAGYSDGFSTTLHISDSVPRWPQMAELFQENFAKIGVDVEIQQSTLSAFSEKLFAREFEMWLGTGIPWVADPWYAMFLTNDSEGYGNFSNYANPEVDAALDELRFTPDPERVVLADKIARDLIDEAVHIYMGQLNETAVVREEIAGYLFTGEDSDFFARLSRT